MTSSNILAPGSKLPFELVNAIIMLQRPKYPFLKELLHFGWSAYQCPGHDYENCPYHDGPGVCDMGRPYYTSDSESDEPMGPIWDLLTTQEQWQYLDARYQYRIDED